MCWLEDLKASVRPYVNDVKRVLLKDILSTFTIQKILQEDNNTYKLEFDPKLVANNPLELFLTGVKVSVVSAEIFKYKLFDDLDKLLYPITNNNSVKIEWKDQSQGIAMLGGSIRPLLDIQSENTQSIVTYNDSSLGTYGASTNIGAIIEQPDTWYVFDYYDKKKQYEIVDNEIQRIENEGFLQNRYLVTFTIIDKYYATNIQPSYLDLPR